jgi:uncharacterized membrane protein YoaK (UPF0700 family)
LQYRLPLVLSANAGYVDCAGFLALQGLFSTHVTGNFVTLGAALVLGSSGTLPKLLALPVFCIAVALVRIIGLLLASRAASTLKLMFAGELALLLWVALLAIRSGPFNNGDSAIALSAGMTLVSAMGIQNAVQRLHLAHVPPTTIMTGNTTQAVIDLVDVLRGGSERAAIRARLAAIGVNIAAFAAGCAAAALLYVYFKMWCFALPPVLALLALVMV